MTDTNLLNAKINERGFKKGFLAQSCGITERTFYNKFIGKTPFNQNEILILIKILNISNVEIPLIFFTDKVEHSSTEEVPNA